jgi:hypothetical protein
LVIDFCKLRYLQIMHYSWFIGHVPDHGKQLREGRCIFAPSFCAADKYSVYITV